MTHTSRRHWITLCIGMAAAGVIGLAAVRQTAQVGAHGDVMSDPWIYRFIILSWYAAESSSGSL